MSKVTKPVVLDETAKQVVAQIQLQNEILTSLASGINYKPTSIKDVLNVVRAGQASKVFQVGDQIIVLGRILQTDRSMRYRSILHHLALLRCRTARNFRA
jgi:hypothetical protein